ncbi:hypothetical protein BDV95DRAFT_593249 [Massariosphaeria phaeospora]|uniref:Uncharacterized protein n=1 Tax=Massariosphaeria phaeospora TaxID=100035 RepID=A0A7C8MDU7_9PLEO|nr:hypothetical protein BDV95DRAFT_593249 [Massariosphaeria phaeospora]
MRNPRSSSLVSKPSAFYQLFKTTVIASPLSRSSRQSNSASSCSKPPPFGPLRRTSSAPIPQVVGKLTTSVPVPTIPLPGSLAPLRPALNLKVTVDDIPQWMERSVTVAITSPWCNDVLLIQCYPRRHGPTDTPGFSNVSRKSSSSNNLSQYLASAHNTNVAPSSGTASFSATSSF